MKRRLSMFIAGMLIGFGAMLIVAFTAEFYWPDPLHAPTVEWGQLSDIPAAVCPGDNVSYLTVVLLSGQLQDGGTLWVSRTIRRADDNADVVALRNDPNVQSILAQYDAELIGDTVIPQQLGTTLILNIPPGNYRRALIDQDSGFTIPDLLPGTYERILSSGMLFVNVEHAVRVQPFTVRDDCGE